MAVLTSYNAYAKDKITGVLESVLSKPISRKGLSTSRYLSTSLALSAAVAVTVILVVVFDQLLVGSVAGLGEFAGYTFLSLAVEAAAFVGIVMLLSHLLRSSGALIGIAITLWLLLDLFWGIVIFGISSALGYDSNSVGNLAVTIQSSFFNPAQFYFLTGSYLSRSINIGGIVTSVIPEAYGLTSFTLVLTGLFWVIVPFAIFLRLANNRD